MRWMNLEPVIQSEVMQKEKKILYINAYIWNLDNWYWWAYLQGRKKIVLIGAGGMRQGMGWREWDVSVIVLSVEYTSFRADTSCFVSMGKHFSSLDLSFLILEDRTMTQLLAVTHEDGPAREVEVVSSCTQKGWTKTRPISMQIYNLLAPPSWYLENTCFTIGFLGGSVKNSPAIARDMGLIFGSGRFLRRKRHPTSVFLPGKSHGQRSLAGSSPWGHKESDTTEHSMDRCTVFCFWTEEEWEV